MSLHPSTFEYLNPTDAQLQQMADVRHVFAEFVAYIEVHVPDGADRAYVVRRLRECAMWCNVAITRNADGTPRA